MMCNIKFEPINPAPPVTNNFISSPPPVMPTFLSQRRTHISFSSSFLFLTEHAMFTHVTLVTYATHVTSTHASLSRFNVLTLQRSNVRSNLLQQFRIQLHRGRLADKIQPQQHGGHPIPFLHPSLNPLQRPALDPHPHP